MRSSDSSDVYRLNVKTGRAVLLTESRPERVPFSGESDDQAGVSWVIDGNLVPRIAVSNPKDTTLSVVYYRKTETSPWEELTRYDSVTGPAFVPLYFEKDNQTLLVASNAGRDTMAVFRYDPNAKKLGELVAQHPRFDMGADASGDSVPGPLRDSKTDEVVGFRVRADKLETVWTDERYQRLQRMIDAALPGMINTVIRTPDGRSAGCYLGVGRATGAVVSTGRNEQDDGGAVCQPPLDFARATRRNAAVYLEDVGWPGNFVLLFFAARLQDG